MSSGTIKTMGKLKGKCKTCNIEIKSRHKYCKEHRSDYIEKSSANRLTFGDIRRRLSVKGKHPSWIHSNVRNLARYWNKEKLSLPCARCGYALHVELAHIVPLSSFSDDDYLAYANGPSNVIQLCRNCNWELDHGLWKP